MTAHHDVVQILSQLPVDLRYEAMDDLAKKDSQSAWQRANYGEKTFELRTEQGKRTDLLPKLTCTQTRYRFAGGGG